MIIDSIEEQDCLLFTLDDKDIAVSMPVGDKNGNVRHVLVRTLWDGATHQITDNLEVIKALKRKAPDCNYRVIQVIQ